jgi:hypothetical protein
MEAIEKVDLTIVSHPPCSPDFEPCDFHFFPPKMKEALHGYL